MRTSHAHSDLSRSHSLSETVQVSMDKVVLTFFASLNAGDASEAKKADSRIP